MSKKSGANNRFSVKRKTEAILRLLRGEDLELVSREYKVTAAKLSQWRTPFYPVVTPGSNRAKPMGETSKSNSSKPKSAS